MRHALVAALGSTLVIVSAVPIHAAPSPVLRPLAWNSASDMIQKIDSLHHYYRRNGVDWHRYYRHHEPLAPVRPLSCGEFRFWNGESCVDVRFR